MEMGALYSQSAVKPALHRNNLKGADLRQDVGAFLVLPFVLAGSSQRFRRKCVHPFVHSLAMLQGRPPRPAGASGRVRFRFGYAQNSSSRF